MKIIILIISFSISVFSYTSPTSYSDAMNELSWTALESSLVHKDMKQKVEEQAANYEVLNRLKQAKIKVEEMIQRDNIASAAKVVDLAFTAAGIVTGGATVAAKEGGKQALKWYLAKKVAVEAGKEAAGVPSYSDAVKVGMYIYNKADERDIKADFSKDSVDILQRAKQLIEVNDGRTLKEKLPELRQMIFDMEDRIEKTDLYLKACVKKLEELKEKAAKLEKDAQKRKEEEDKKTEEAKKRIKDVEVKPSVDTSSSKPVDVPVQIGEKDSESDRRAKIQSAIYSYTASLSKSFNEIETKISDKYNSFPGALTLRNLSRDPKTEVEIIINAINYYKSNIAAETYISAQDIEESASTNLKNLRETRIKLEGLKSDVKSSIEPMIKEMAEVVAKWKGVYNKYKPLGFDVPLYPPIEGSYAWSWCYVGALSYIETFLTGTSGMEGELSNIESAAKSLKNKLYSNAYKFASDFAALVEDLKNYIEPTENKINSLIEESGKIGEPIGNLSHYFVMEFSYSGEHDLNNIKKRIQEAEAIYPKILEKIRMVSILYREFSNKLKKFDEFYSDRSYSEVSSISYSSHDQSHKSSMESLYKKINGYYPYTKLGTVEPEKRLEAYSNMIFQTKNAVDYLEKQKQKIIAVYQKAASCFQTKSQKDFSNFYSNGEMLSKSIEELNSCFSKADEERSKIIGEISEVSFYGEEEPTLKHIGFWDKELGKKIEEVEKMKSDFWASNKGQTITHYMNIEELRKSQETKNPELIVVRKLYDDLKSAYESRNASKVLSLIDSDWTSPDGDAISDLSEHLRRIFSMFNEITFNIANLNIVSEGNGLYSVSYNLEMTSKIYSKNIKREEKSSVYEKVKVENGKAKIIKTEIGNYWAVK